MIDSQIRRAALQTLSHEFLNLYDSPYANSLNEEMLTKYGINPDKRGAYLHVTGDIILGFYKIADLPRLLKTEVGVTPEVAQKITADLIDAWGAVVEREAAEASAKKAELSTLAAKIAAIPPKGVDAEDLNFLSNDVPAQPAAIATPAVKPTDTPTSPAQADEPLVKPIRTMQADIGKVHGYGALATSTDSEEPVVKALSQDELRPKP